MSRYDTNHDAIDRPMTGRGWPSRSSLLAACIVFGCALPASAGPAFAQDGDQPYVTTDGTVSRRLDLKDEEDRRLLASMIMTREGRVYAFEKTPSAPAGRQNRRDVTPPQVFDLEMRHDADRLAAAISSGRSTFFIARPAEPIADDPVATALADATGEIAESPPARQTTVLQPPRSEKPRLTAERVDRYAVDGQVGKRVDMDDPLHRLRLKALIAKQEGRVYSFKKGDAITGAPEAFDVADRGDAERLTQQIGGGDHVFFMVEDVVEHRIVAAAKGSAQPARSDEAKAPETPKTSSAQRGDAPEKGGEPEGLGGPIQLFPMPRADKDVALVAADNGTRSDADLPILDFLDEPLPGDGQAKEPAQEPKAEQVAALTDPVKLEKDEPPAEPAATLRPAPEAPSPAPPRPFEPAEAAPPAVTKSPAIEAPREKAPRDEAEVIAALEEQRQIRNLSTAEDTSKRSAKRTGGVVAVDAPKQTLDLAVGEGRLLRLPEPIAKLLIADPGVADAQVMSDDLIYIFGNQLGQTNIFGLTSEERVSADFDIRIGSNVAGARERLRELQPDTMADYTHVGGQVVAQGLVRDPAEAYQVAALGDAIAGDGQPALNNTVMPGAQQVNIRVRFAEVSRNDIARLGMNWEAILDSGDFLFGLSSGNLFLPDGGGGIDSTESFSSIFGSASFGDFNLDIFLEGLEREGIVNVLAEPNLTAINGQPANFLAGGEIPIPVPQTEGIITIDYKPFGVSLEFLPTLMPGNRINLQVRPEVSSIVSNGGVVLQGFNIPAFTVRRAETAVELASGQTFAIAGLFQRSVTSDIDKFPVVGDVPVIGNLFKSPRFQRSETELVILITPYLVEPTRSANLTVPNQRVDQAVPPVEPRQPTSGLGGFIID